MKIVVLGGGISTERHVSLVTAASVCRALRRLGHQAIFVDLFFGLEEYEGKLEDAFDAPDGLCPEPSIGHTAPDLREVKSSRKWKSPSRIGKNVLEICSLADCVFLGLHGEDGEDGKIQAALELMGIPYTGSAPLPSGLAMDKAMAKKIMHFAGIPTAAWEEYDLNRTDVSEILDRQSLPCVVKVTNGGSSIGVYICDTKEELQSALRQARSAAVLSLRRKNAGGNLRCLCWQNARSTPLRSSRRKGTPPLTMWRNIRAGEKGHGRSARRISRLSSRSFWEILHCAFTGRWGFPSIPGRILSWTNREIPGVWRSIHCRA